jgi:hypothetical protein
MTDEKPKKFFAIRHPTAIDDVVDIGEPLWWNNYWGWGTRSGACCWPEWEAGGPTPEWGEWVEVPADEVEKTPLEKFAVLKSDEMWHEPGWTWAIHEGD